MSVRESLFQFRVVGTERSNGTIMRKFEQDGQIRAEHLAEAAVRLSMNEILWELINDRHGVVIEIEPIEEGDA